MLGKRRSSHGGVRWAHTLPTVLNAILRRYPLPVAYLSLLGLVSAIYAGALSRADQRFLVGWSSTNLANLGTRPVSTMVVSAFVTDDPFVVWAVATSLGLWLLVRRFGNLRAALLVVVSHVAGTLVSEGIAYWRLSSGEVPAGIRHIADVGPSYVTVSALFAVALYGRRPWKRMVAFTCWLALAPFLFEGLGSWEVAAVGHAVATLGGALIGGCYVLHERVTGRKATVPAVTPPTRPVGAMATAK